MPRPPPARLRFSWTWAKGSKEAGKICGGDPDAVVGDGDAKLAGAGTVQGECDLAAGGRELLGVSQEVAHHLRQARRSASTQMGSSKSMRFIRWFRLWAIGR